LLGVRGERIAQHMMAAVHGTVTGLVLVGLAEGLILGIVYRAVELPYSASLGALTESPRSSRSRRRRLFPGWPIPVRRR